MTRWQLAIVVGGLAIVQAMLWVVGMRISPEAQQAYEAKASVERHAILQACQTTGSDLVAVRAALIESQAAMTLVAQGLNAHTGWRGQTTARLERLLARPVAAACPKAVTCAPCPPPPKCWPWSD